MLLPPPPTESRRLLEITEKTREIQQPQLGSSALRLTGKRVAPRACIYPVSWGNGVLDIALRVYKKC